MTRSARRCASRATRRGSRWSPAAPPGWPRSSRAGSRGAGPGSCSPAATWTRARLAFVRRGVMVVLMLLSLPATAHAGTVSAPGFAGVEFDAAAGEANQVGVRLSHGVLKVRDDGAPLKATGGCRSTGEHTATCADERLGWSVVVDTRDGNDTVTINTRRVTTSVVRLGDGDDQVSAKGGGPLYSYGGAGNDQILGGSGSDYMQGGPGADLMDGRDGVDQVLYE